MTFAIASRIRSLSPEMTAHLRRVYGHAAASKAVVVPTRVDLSIFKHVKSDFSVRGPLRLIAVGSWAPVKNHVQLMRDLHETRIPFELSLVGAGPLLGEYQAEAARLGIVERVRFVGQLSQQELAGLLPNHDAYVQYSISEGLPRALLEAMAAGLPVVASRVGGVPEIIESGVNGLLVAPDRPAELAAAVLDLIARPQVAGALGVAAREKAERQFSFDRMVSGFEHLYLSELGRRAVGSEPDHELAAS
jgi:glycosyltransferase involved in cell wall biosynthesis